MYVIRERIEAGEDPLLIIASVLALDLALERQEKKEEEMKEERGE